MPMIVLLQVVLVDVPKGGIGGEAKVVVEKLVTFLHDDGVRVASVIEEKEVRERMTLVSASEECVEVPGWKAQDRGKVNRKVKALEGLMPNLVKDGMSESEIYWVVDRLGLMGKKKGHKLEKNPRLQRRIENQMQGRQQCGVVFGR